MATHIAAPAPADPIDRRALGEKADCDLEGGHRVAGAAVFFINCLLLLAPPVIAILALVGAIR